MTAHTSDSETISRTWSKGPFRSRLFWLIIAGIGITAFFWDGITSLYDAWSRPEYSHGPIIPLIAGYLLLRECRDASLKTDLENRVPGFVFLFFGLLVGLVGNLTQIPYLITYGFIIVVGSLILVVTGIRQALRLWPALVYLVFMLPLPNFMYWKLSTTLQFISSRLGVDFIQMIGIPVYLEGNIIDLGVYKLQVAEACSGLNYLFPLMSFGFLFAVLYRGPLWHKGFLFLSTIPITVLMNSFRIGVIGVLVNQYGIEQAEGFLHFFEGWIIFVACIGLLYVEALILQQLTRHPERASNILDLDMSGILPVLNSASTIPAAKALITASLLVCISGAVWQLTPARSATEVSRQQFTLFPMDLKGWRGSTSALDVNVQVVLGADEYLLADFANKTDNTTVNLFTAYYHSITDGSGTHSPEICIPGGGWEVSRWQQTEVSPNGSERFTTNKAIIQKGTDRRLVYYWFERGGSRFASEYAFKLNTVLDALRTGRSDGALVRLITTIAPGESETAAGHRLNSFIKPMSDVMPRFLPE
ncbi:MAG: VPLPA-CTERM-specific exosortase XrtD [Paracoccaceae bacterium]